MKVVIVRYDEIGLKSNYVYSRLLVTLRNQIQKIVGGAKIVSRGRRLIIYKELNKDKLSILSKVFGISTISLAIEAEQKMESIIKNALRLYKGGSFRVSCRRADKGFKYTSKEIEQIVGEEIVKRKGAKVDLKNFDTEIGIELFNGKAYLFTEKIRGYGGLPAKTQGKVITVLNTKRDLIAALTMMKRGIDPIVVGNSKIISLLEKEVPYLKLEQYNKTIEAKAVCCGAKLEELESIISLKERYKLPIFAPLVCIDEKKTRFYHSL